MVYFNVDVVDGRADLPVFRQFNHFGFIFVKITIICRRLTDHLYLLVDTRLLDVIQEVSSNFLLGGLHRVALHVIIIDALAEIQFEVRVHVLFRVLGETQATLRHAVIEERV